MTTKAPAFFPICHIFTFFLSDTLSVVFLRRPRLVTYTKCAKSAILGNRWRRKSNTDSLHGPEQPFVAASLESTRKGFSCPYMIQSPMKQAAARMPARMMNHHSFSPVSRAMMLPSLLRTWATVSAVPCATAPLVLLLMFWWRCRYDHQSQQQTADPAPAVLPLIVLSRIVNATVNSRSASNSAKDLLEIRCS